jgi:hypothetical protein
MAGGGSNTSTSYSIPQNPYIDALVNQTVGMLGETQKTAPLYQFAQPQERRIAGMSPLQQYAGGMVGQIGQGNPYSQGARDLLGYRPPAAPPQNFGQGQLGQMTDPVGIPRYNNPRNLEPNREYGVQAPMSFGQGQLGQMGGPSQSQSFEKGGGDEWKNPWTVGGGTGSGGVGPGGGGAGGGVDPNSALGQLQQLTSGPIGSSPATQAGMAAFQQNVLPTLQNELGSMGLGRSGIGAEQIQRASTSAAVPLIQQEIANREQGIGQYGNIANQLAGLGQQDVQNWTTAAGLGSSLGGTQQQTAQASLDAPYQDYLRRQALAQSSTGLGGIPYSAPMQQTTTSPSSGFFGK